MLDLHVEPRGLSGLGFLIVCVLTVISLFSSLKWDDTHYIGSETPSKA